MFVQVPYSGVTLLTKGLLVNDTIRVLKIGGNPIGSNGSLELIRAISHNSKTAVEILDIAVRSTLQYLYH